MTELDHIDQRHKERLLDLLNEKFGGSTDLLAKSLGQANGGFIREMKEGKKRVTDKTIRKIEGLRPSFSGWFSKSRSAESDKNRSETFLKDALKSQTLGVADVRKVKRPATNGIHSPAMVRDWVKFGSSDVIQERIEGGPFDALVAPGPFPSSFELTTVPGDWMEPEIKFGDCIWVDRTIKPKSEDIVIALDTKTGRTFMGEYLDGYGGAFFVKPRKGERADSTIHPVSVLAVMVGHLRLRDSLGRNS
jgi:hypothetical protein